jgi:asparagine synthase (glutamine-hydrolysing)
MGGICGIVNFDGKPVDPGLLRRMAEAAAHRGPDGIDYWIQGHVGFAHLALHTTLESEQEHQPLVNQRGDIVLTADARVDNRDELLHVLTIKNSLNLKAPTDVNLILAAYDCWGEECAKHIVGDFVIAVFNRKEQSLMLVRDHLGVKPVYYSNTEDSFVFGSEIYQVLQSPYVDKKLNNHAMALHIANMQLPADETFFERVSLLEPASAIIVKNGKTLLKDYWHLNPGKSIKYVDEKEYIGHFLWLFQKVMSSKLRAISPFGVMLSGGLDSSVVACMISTHNPLGDRTLLKAFTWDFAGAEAIKPADEKEYAEAVASEYGIQLVRIPAHENWPLSDIGFSTHPDSPFCGHYQALIRATLLAARQREVRTVFTGYAGDEVVGGTVLPYTDYLLRLEWCKLIKDLKLHTKNTGNHILRIFFEGCLSPIIQSLLTQTIRRFFQDATQIPPWMTTELVQTIELDDYNTRKSIRSMKFNTWAQQQRYFRLTQPIYSRTNLWLDRLAAEMKMDLRHPWLDVRLFEYMLSIPQSVVSHAGVYKSVARKAFASIVPADVVQRQKTVNPSPLYRWGIEIVEKKRIERMFKNSIADKMGLIDASKVVQYLGQLNDQGHSETEMWKGYRYDLWNTISLELWLNDSLRI